MKQKPINYRYTVFYVISQISTLIVISFIDFFRYSKSVIICVAVLSVIATYLFLNSVFSMADYSSVTESVAEEREKAAMHLKKYREIAMRQSFLSEMIHDIIHRHFVTAQLPEDKTKQYLEKCREDYGNSFNTEFTGHSAADLALNYYCFHSFARTGRIPEITVSSLESDPEMIIEKTAQLERKGSYPSLIITKEAVEVC